MEMNIYIGFWTLKMKCTQHGLYGQAAFKTARTIYFLKLDEASKEHGLHLGSEKDVPGAGPNPGQM